MVYTPGLGIRIERAAAAVAITVSPGAPCFTIAGGFVLIKALIGICTVAFGGANTLSFELNPTDASGANTAICGATDIGTAATAGDVCVVVGAPGTGILGGHVPVNVIGSTIGQGIACAPGALGLVATAANGTMRWILWYLPIDVGATVVAV